MRSWTSALTLVQSIDEPHFTSWRSMKKRTIPKTMLLIMAISKSGGLML